MGISILSGCIGEVKQDPNKKDQTDISSDGSSTPPPEGENNEEEQDSAGDSSSINTTSDGTPLIELEPDFSFSGISKIQATSDTRITIWFKPVMVTLGDETYPAVPPQSDSESGKTDILYMYEVVKDEISGSRPPIASFPDAGLELNSNGEFVVSIDIGESGDCGIYNVIARDIKNNTKLNPESYFKVCTYNYYFPDFEGISLVEERQGCARETGAKVSWKIATRAEQLSNDIARLNTTKEEKFQQVLTQEITYATYSLFEEAINEEISRISAYTPTAYYIYWNTEEQELLDRLNNPIATPNATITNINTTTFDVDELENGRTYYFAIRSVTDLIFERNGRVIDQNFKIFRYSIPSEEDIQFNGVAQVEIPPNSLGYSEAIVKFSPCKGCNKYRIWAFEDEIPSNFQIDDVENLKGTIDLDSAGIVDSYKVSGLQAHKTYYFKVAALKMCDGTEIQGQELGLEGIGKTSPNLAPFNGISNIYSTGSLTSLSMNWELPDTTSGVFNQYRLFMKVNDSQAIEVFNSDIDQETENGIPIPRISNRFPLDNTSLKELTISNISAGENPENSNAYCFALGLKEADQLGENRVGKTTPPENLKYKCFNFHYTPPVFNGPNIGSCNSASTSFTAAFDLPSEGTFDEVRIYYKEYREIGDIGYLGEEDDFGIIENGNMIDYEDVELDTANVKANDLGIGETYDNNPWKRIVLYHNPEESPRLETPGILEDFGWVIKDDKPVVPIRNLKPDTWYVYALELYYNPVGRDPIYIRPNRIEKCQTAKPQIYHSGWAHLLSIGKKTNGLQGNKWIPEKIVFQNGPQKNSNGEYDDTIKDSYYFIKEDKSIDADTGFSTVTNENKLTEGIVHLSWFDFKISQSGTYTNTLIEGEVGDSVSNFYYKIERSTDPDFIESVDLPGEIPVKKGIYLYHYVDDKISSGGQKYYYRVNLWKGGTALTYSNYEENGSIEKITNLKNKVLEVIVPPPNMAFIHQYMINKTQCRKIDLNLNHGRDILSELKHPNAFDPSAPQTPTWDFSGLETGLNKKNIRADSYLTPPSINFDITNNYRCKYKGIGSKYDAETEEYYYDIGTSYLVDRYEMSANIGPNEQELASAENQEDAKLKCKYENTTPALCSTSTSNLTTLYAKEGATAYFSGNYGGKIYEQKGVSYTEDDLYKNDWEEITDPTIDQLSNSAYLPPVIFSNPTTMKNICFNRRVNLDNTEYKGRLPSRQEYVFLGQPYEHLSPYAQIQIFTKDDTADAKFSLNSDLSYTCNTTTYQSTKPLSRGLYTFPFRSDQIITNDNMNNYYPTSYINDVTTNSTTFYMAGHLYKTGSYFTSDNSSEGYSSHLCVSKFGLQDVVGNVGEVTSDFFSSTEEGVIYLDIEKTTDQDVRDMWKLSPFNLLTSEGDNLLPFDISIHNYYSSELGDFIRGYSGFHSLEETIHSSQKAPYWNPMAGLNFKDPEYRSGSKLEIDFSTFYENFENIKTPYIYDDGINIPVVADDDNFLFSNLLQNAYRSGMTEPDNGAPTKLQDKGKKEKAMLFYYEFKQSFVTFKSMHWMTRFKLGWDPALHSSVIPPSPLIFGGAGMGLGLNRGSSLDVGIDDKAKVHFSNYSSNTFDNTSRSGFRCIFPIKDTSL